MVMRSSVLRVAFGAMGLAVVLLFVNDAAPDWLLGGTPRPFLSATCKVLQQQAALRWKNAGIRCLLGPNDRWAREPSAGEIGMPLWQATSTSAPTEKEVACAIESLGRAENNPWGRETFVLAVGDSIIRYPTMSMVESNVSASHWLAWKRRDRVAWKKSLVGGFRGVFHYSEAVSHFRKHLQNETRVLKSDIGRVTHYIIGAFQFEMFMYNTLPGKLASIVEELMELYASHITMAAKKSSGFFGFGGSTSSRVTESAKKPIVVVYIPHRNFNTLSERPYHPSPEYNLNLGLRDHRRRLCSNITRNVAYRNAILLGLRRFMCKGCREMANRTTTATLCSGSRKDGLPFRLRIFDSWDAVVEGDVFDTMHYFDASLKRVRDALLVTMDSTNSYMDVSCDWFERQDAALASASKCEVDYNRTDVDYFSNASFLRRYGWHGPRATEHVLNIRYGLELAREASRLQQFLSESDKKYLRKLIRALGRQFTK